MRTLKIEREGMAKIKVLVVDDSALIRSIMREIINSHPDLEVVGQAADPLVARDLIKQLNPDVLTLDVEMPRMNGLELTSHVRANAESHDLPIIMITSRSTEKHRRQAKSVGVDVYLTKPFSEDELAGHIQTQMARSGSRHPRDAVSEAELTSA